MDHLDQETPLSKPMHADVAACRSYKGQPTLLQANLVLLRLEQVWAECLRFTALAPCKMGACDIRSVRNVRKPPPSDSSFGTGASLPASWHARTAELMLISLGTTLATRISDTSWRALCHCEHLAQALITELYVMSSTARTDVKPESK